MQFSAIVCIRASIVWLALCGAAQVHAQTVVPNQDFDSALTPWVLYLSSSPDPDGAGAAPTWVTSPDFLSSPSSGSALVDMVASPTTPDATNASSGIFQCINLASTASVNFVNYSGSFFVPVATAADSNVAATVEVRLFSSANCAGFIDGASQAQTFVTGINNATWFSFGDTNFVLAGTLPVSVCTKFFQLQLIERLTLAMQGDLPLCMRGATSLHQSTSHILAISTKHKPRTPS